MAVSPARPPKTRPIVYLLALAALAVACATVPITGRSQLSLISDEAAIQMAGEHFNAFMAVRQGAVLQASESPEAAQTLETIKRVSGRIIDASGLRGARQWDVVVVKDPRNVNASVTFNGKIVVFTGLLPVAQDDAGLAAILGHEVGHVAGRHAVEKASQAYLAQVGVLTAQAVVAVATKNPRLVRTVGDLGGLAAHFGILLPFSRAHESEADRLGLVYMAKAGYDPAAALGVWERMENIGGAGPPEFFSTHPSPATRRADIQAWLPEARRYYAESGQKVPAVALASSVSALPAPASVGGASRSTDSAAPEVHVAPPAGAALEVQLQALDSLLSRQTITEIEYGLLRKRLIETWSFKGEFPGAASQTVAVARTDRPWILGRWEGGHQGPQVSMDGASFVFTQERGQVKWLMRRRTMIGNWTGNLQASGTVVAFTNVTVELRGSYDGFSEGRTGGKPLEYSLRRDGDQLEGMALGSTGIPFSVSLRRR